MDIHDYTQCNTNPKLINQMLDMVDYDFYTTFLEPTCGRGNFLVEILKHKLQWINSINENDYILQTFIALSSIYGIDIIEDCVETTRRRLAELVEENYLQRFRKELPNKRYWRILNQNIIQQDILSYSTNKHFNIIIGNPPFWIDDKPVYKDIVDKLNTISHDELILVLPREEDKYIVWEKKIDE